MEPKVPLEVCESIFESYPHMATAILRELAYSHLLKCWYFYRFGMFIGVEPDGHIHT